jgi:hypothetical protein
MVAIGCELQRALDFRQSLAPPAAYAFHMVQRLSRVFRRGAMRGGEEQTRDERTERQGRECAASDAMPARVRASWGLIALAAAVLVSPLQPSRLVAAAELGATAAPARYAEIAVVAPAKEQTVHDNLGRVEVRIALQPALQERHEHRLQIFLDERPAATLTAGQSHTLSGVERGAHTLRAAVVGSDGRELATSESVTFFMWQASKLFPQRTDRQAAK